VQRRGWVQRAVVHMHDVRTCWAVDDARSIFALEGPEGFEEFDDVGFVRGVAARCSPVRIIEGACLRVYHDKGGVGVIDCHLVEVSMLWERMTSLKSRYRGSRREAQGVVKLVKRRRKKIRDIGRWMRRLRTCDLA
jgi:hypothetical protein